MESRFAEIVARHLSGDSSLCPRKILGKRGKQTVVGFVRPLNLPADGNLRDRRIALLTGGRREKNDGTFPSLIGVIIIAVGVAEKLARISGKGQPGKRCSNVMLVLLVGRLEALVARQRRWRKQRGQRKNKPECREDTQVQNR